MPFQGDASPSVVIDVGGGFYIIYGHVEIDSALLAAAMAAGNDGVKVKLGGVIGSLQNQRALHPDGSLKRDNTHVHLAVRKGLDRTYNPPYFFKDPQVLSGFTWSYAAGENLYSISSYRYGRGLNFWQDPTAVDLTRN